MVPVPGERAGRRIGAEGEKGFFAVDGGRAESERRARGVVGRELPGRSRARPCLRFGETLSQQRLDDLAR